MTPQIVTAIIAASVSFLTLIGTLAMQYFGRRATSRDTEKTLEQQGKQLDRTLREQREQLDRTLTEQSKQLDRTLAEQRTRTLNERFAAAASQLGNDKPPTVQLAGLTAIAGLADDWVANRQTCVNVLCGYLRMPYEPDPGEEAPQAARLAFQAGREVRHTVIRVITAHLNGDAPVSWQGLNFDFRGVVFDGGDFGEAEFSGGTVCFDRAKFPDGQVSFHGVTFSGGKVSLDRAEFSGGEVLFDRAGFTGGNVPFTFAEFADGAVSFDNARFFGGHVNYFIAHFCGGQVSFHDAEFSDGQVHFGAKFADGEVNFDRAKFSGGQVSFDGAEFSGGEVDFSHALEWSVPPVFGWPAHSPPPGVRLPGKQDQPQP